MNSTEPFPELVDLADFYLYQDREEDFFVPKPGLRLASPGETKHLRYRLRQLTASVARESRFVNALRTAEANGMSSEETTLPKQRAFWAKKDVERQRRIVQEDDVVQRYESSNPADPMGLRANASAYKINWRYENGGPEHGKSWNVYFAEERRCKIDVWTPTIRPAKTEGEITRQQELDEQYEHSKKELREFQREREVACRRYNQLYATVIQAAEKQRAERRAREMSLESVKKQPTGQESTAVKEAIAAPKTDQNKLSPNGEKGQTGAA